MRLIDADALIDKYGDWYTEEGNEEGYIGTIKGIVNRMPTVEERKSSRWLQSIESIGGVCANCGGECSAVELTDTGIRYLWNFCPNCGADMRGTS